MKFVVLLLLAFSFKAFSQIETKEVYPFEDTWVSSSFQSKNKGSELYLDLGTYHAGSRALMKFDKEEIKSLLEGKELISARLELPIKNHYIHRTGTIGLHKMNRNWDENKATWKCANDTNLMNWKNDCPDDSWLMWSHNPNNTTPYPYELTSFATATIERNQEMPLGFDVASYVLNLVAEESNYGFAIYKDSTNINDPLKLFSREADIKPKLILKLKMKVVVSKDITAKLTSNLSKGLAPLNIIFDASSSSTLKGSITSYSLDLGDGNKIELDKNNPTLTHDYQNEGEYQAVLTVKNDSGDESVSAINISAIGTEKGQVDNNYGYWVSPDENLKVDYKAGEQAIITGDICKVWKTSNRKNNPHCHWVDKSRLHIQAFYPDMTSDVSSLFKVTQKGQKREFEYKTPSLVSDDLNVLTVLVGEIDPRVIRFGSIKAKLQRRLKIIDSKLTYLRKYKPDSYIIDILERVRGHLSKICKKIDIRNAQQPTVLAQYNYPIQVDNKVSAPRYYSTLIGGFRVELSSDIGNIFESEKVQIQSRVSNVNYQKSKYHKVEQYKLKYSYQGEHLKTLSEFDFSEGKVHEFNFIDQNKSIADTLYDLDLEIIEKYKWWEKKLASAHSYLPVIKDTIAPVWQNKITDIQYTQNFPRLISQVKDDIGRIDLSTLNVILSGQMTGNISDKFKASTPDRGTEYLFACDIKEDFNQEGDYTVNYSVKDFKGQDATPEPYSVNYTIDRTAPVLSVAQADNQLTNNPNFTLPISVVDHSPVTILVIHNGNKIGEFNDKDSSFSLTLVEEDNVIEVKVVDAAGNEGESFKLNSIHLDTIPPELISSSPFENEIIRRLDITVQGKSNEPLSTVIIDDTVEGTIDVDKINFSGKIQKTTQGVKNLKISLTDLAGNTSEHIVDYQIVLKLILPELIITFEQNDGKILVQGTPGSIASGSDLEISGGFFNNKDITVNIDGSFEVSLDFFETATLKAYYAPLDKTEAEIISSNINTNLSGIVKDAVSDMGLKGVKVTVQETGKSGMTNDSGVFNISEPGLGNATLIVDGTTIEYGEAELNENGIPKKKYATQVVKVNLSSKKKNILERPVYFTPLFMDGTQTVVRKDEAVVVTSPHALGVELHIPANIANFSGLGTDPVTGEEVKAEINVVKLDKDKTTFNPPKSINPDFVYSFEPSGLTFKEPVKLVLPNENEFVIGQRLIIMSKNSATGQWEADGLATVTGNNSIETDDDSGITHFSDIYAVPYSPDVSTFNKDKDKPQLTTGGNSAETTITLPSFKKFGQKYTPMLTYKSNWANPRALVSQIFNLEKQHYVKDINQSENVNALIKTEVKGNYKYWTVPDYIKSTFYVDNKESEEITFNISNAPENAVVSYSMNLDDVNTGIYRARSEYKIRFKHFEQLYAKIYARDRITNSRDHVDTIDEGPKELDDIENDGIIIPKPLDNIIYHQNYVNSPLGRGWRLNLAQQVYQPKDERLMIEEVDGKISQYVMDNTIENIATDDRGIITLNTQSFPEISYSTYEGQIVRINESNNILKEIQTGNHIFGIGLNFAQKIGRPRKTFGSWPNKDRRYNHQFMCYRKRSNHNLRKKIYSLFESGDEYFYLDHRGAIYKYDGNEELLGGRVGTPGSFDRYQNSLPSTNPHCQFYTQGASCTSFNPNSSRYYDTGYINPSSYNVNRSTCIGLLGYDYGSGSVPIRGYDNTTDSKSSRLYDPKAIVPSKINGGVFYIADTLNNRVRKINTLSNKITTYAGTGDSGDSSSAMHTPGRTATSTDIYRPNGLIEDSKGNLYVSTERGYVRKITPDGKIFTIAGKTRSSTVATNTSLDNVRLTSPWGLALNEDYNFLYVADSGNNRIVALELKNNKAVQVAGKGQSSCSPNPGEGKPALDTDICSVSQIALDADGNLMFVDHRVKMIRKVILQKPTQSKFRFKPIAEDGSKIIRNSDGTLDRIYRGGQVISFDSTGKQASIIDLHNKETKYTYNDNKLTSISFPDNTKMDFIYSDNRLSEIVDPSGRVTRFTQVDGKLEIVEFPDKTSQEFTYRLEDGALVAEKNKRGFLTQYSYNKWDFLEKIISPDNKEVVMSYRISDTVGNDAIDGHAKEVESTANDEGKNNFKDIYTDKSEVSTEMLKDMNGQVETIVEKLPSGDRVSTLERDSLGRLTKVIKHTGDYTTFVYSNSGISGLPYCDIVIINEANTPCVSKEIGDLIEKYDSKSDTLEKYEYNKYGDLLYKEIKVEGEIVSKLFSRYDSVGNLIEQEDALGKVKYIEYYPNGLKQKSYTLHDGIKEQQNFFYDERGNLSKIVYPEGEEKIFERDDAGNILVKTDVDAVKTEYFYDDFNRLTAIGTGIIEGKSAIITSYKYDNMGNLEEILDPKGNSTSFVYDELDRTISKTSPNNKTIEIDYDDKNNVNWKKDANQNITTFVYNDRNKLIKKTHSDNVYQMTYNDNDLLKSISDNDSSISFEYEKINKEYVVSETTVNNEGMDSYILTSTYNSRGNRTLLTTPFGSFNYDYNDIGQLTSLANHKSETFNFYYDYNHRLNKVERNGSFTTYSFDQNIFMTGISHKKSDNSEIISNVYTRDYKGNKLTETTSNFFKKYMYDERSQLTKIEDSESTSANTAYSYDLLGNRITDQTGNYTYDSKSQKLKEDFKYLYFYDDNGNMTSRQEKGMTGTVTHYKYSSENQLVELHEYVNSNLKKSVIYKYDALGRRFAKEITNHTDTSKSYQRKYLYDGNEILAELDQNNNTLGIYTHSGIRTDDVLAVDVLDTKLANSIGSYYYLKNSLGSITDILDSSGDLIQHYAYSAFGKILKISSNSAQDITSNPFVKTSYGFTNREHDEESGMLYYRARFYIPEIGRFIQEDPHPGVQDIPMSINSKYIYALNNPLKYRDPNGKFPTVAVMAIIGGIIGGVNAAIKNRGTGRNFFEAVLEGVIEGAAIGAGIGYLGGISAVAGYTVLTTSFLQAAFTKKGNFFDNFGTYASQNLGKAIFLKQGKKILEGKLPDFLKGEGDLLTYVGWALDFDTVYDTACSEDGTQKDQQVCEQRPNIINIKL